LGRSRTRAKAEIPTSARSGGGRVPATTPASSRLPRVWQGIGYRPLPDAGNARPLFEFAALPWPATDAIFLAWGAFAAASSDERLVGALVADRSGSDAMVHGPVVIVETDPLEIAAQLVAAALDDATASGITTVFARPQGLDRVWVRYGFIPVPESTLPAGLTRPAGAGLYAWRGGSALWTLREARPA
jgi:hypothetical protein